MLDTSTDWHFVPPEFPYAKNFEIPSKSSISCTFRPHSHSKGANKKPQKLPLLPKCKPMNDYMVHHKPSEEKDYPNEFPHARDNLRDRSSACCLRRTAIHRQYEGQD
jgi:hypothetical protein